MYIYMINLFLFVYLLFLFTLINKTKSYTTVLYLFVNYILVCGIYLLYINADLFAGFLWVIDFNLLFIFLLFTIYLIHLFKNNSKVYKNTNMYIFKIIYILIIINILFYLSNLNAINLSCLNINWLVTYISYYCNYAYIYKTNLFILYLTYYKLNVDLFILINLILFYSIILVIYLYASINYLKINKIYKYKLSKYFMNQKYQKINFQKYKYNSYLFF